MPLERLRATFSARSLQQMTSKNDVASCHSQAGVLIVVSQFHALSPLLQVADQLVQLSVAGLVVGVAAAPVAITPIRDGIEKYVLTQAAGTAAVMLASFVKVTVKGLLACPLALTVRALVRVWELPLVAVEKFQITSLGVEAMQPVWVTLRALVV